MQRMREVANVVFFFVINDLHRISTRQIRTTDGAQRSEINEIRRLYGWMAHLRRRPSGADQIIPAAQIPHRGRNGSSKIDRRSRRRAINCSSLPRRRLPRPTSLPRAHTYCCVYWRRHAENWRLIKTCITCTRCNSTHMPTRTFARM